MNKKNNLLVLRLLRWFCPAHLYEGIAGDLLEQFELDVRKSGARVARLKLTWNVFRFFRPGIVLRRRFSISFIHHDMIKNYFKIAWRTTLRHRSNTFINILGMTCGLGVAIMLLCIVRFEYSFDRFHAKIDRLYQIRSYDRYGNDASSQVPQGVVHALQRQFPTVEHAAVVYGWTPGVIRVGNENLQQKNNFFIHPEFLEMIDVEWVKGSLSSSLKEVYQVVLDEPTATKLFPNEDPIGKVIRYDNVFDLTVSGVIKQMPANSEFQMQMIMSYETLTKYMGNYANEDYWGGGDSWFHGYVLLKRDVDRGEVEQQLTAIATELGDKSHHARFELSPLTKSHFDVQTDPFNYVVPFWFLKVFICVAAFLIIIACINFINLATAQASQRGREIGLRKIMGGNRTSIVVQFLIETFVLVTASVFLGSLLATELVHHADIFFVTKVSELRIWDREMILYTIGLILTVTILAGFYPSIVLSGFHPLRAFKSAFSNVMNSGVSLRRTLVVTQFVIAQVLIICMIIAIQQIDFFYKTDHGFEKDNIMIVNMAFKDSVLLRDRFSHALLQHPEIREVTFSLTTPASDRNWWWGEVESPEILAEGETFRLQWVDNNFFNFYHIPIIAGRNFNSTDTLPVALVNEEAVRAAQLENPEDMLGREISYWTNNKVKVIGVVSNYYSQSLKSEVVPHLFMNAGWNFQVAQIKLDPLHAKEAAVLVEKYWKEIHPDNYFEYEFLDDTLEKFYDNENKFSNFIQLFGITGMVIGCLGLYGLVSFVCVKRTKEISIRKVLGATLTNILQLLSAEFLILLSVAVVIAAPIGWVVMNRFLQEYAYQIEIHWTVFVAAAGLTLLVALLTITFRSVKTAFVNPAEKLKCE